MKKITALFLVLCMAGAMLATFTACGDKKSAKAESYVNLNINPEISLMVDGDGYVISAIGENEDGQVLLFGESGIVGAKVERASEIIVDLACRMGFLSEENKTVEVLVSSSNEKADEKLQSKLEAKITAAADKKGLSVTVSHEGTYSLLRAYDAFRAKYPDSEVVRSLSVADFKLAMSASENGDITIEAALELDREELIRIASEAHARIEVFSTAAFKQAKQMAEAAFDKAETLLADAVYAGYYTQNILEHPTTAYLGYLYQVYAMGAHAVDALADSVAYIESLGAVELNEETVNALLDVFDLTAQDKAKLENSEGKVTVDSATAYADLYIKNLPSTQNAIEIKREVGATLDAAEAKAREEIARLAETYRPQIEAALNTLAPVVALYEQAVSVLPTLSDEEKEEMVRVYKEAVAELRAFLEADVPASEKLRSIADKLRGGMATTLTKIEADLSEQELAEIEARLAEIRESLKTERKAMEDALYEAEQEASRYLTELKAKYLLNEPNSRTE